MTRGRRLSVVRVGLVLLLGGIALEAQQPQDQPSSAADRATPVSQIPTRVKISSGVATRLLRKKVAPEYPPLARNQRIQGVVTLNATISQEGDITDLIITSGEPSLAGAAAKAVRKWKYKPYLLDGKAVEVETSIQVNFTLSGG